MEDSLCPLCIQPLDETDVRGQFCGCNFTICLFCQQRIVDEAAVNGVPPTCPNCRSVYDQDRIQKQQHDPNLLEEARKLARREDKKKNLQGAVKSRRDLADLRVVQRNLVYAVGLPLEICREEVLGGQEYFGQYGKVIKISVSRSGPYGAAGAKNGPTGSAYVTYRKADDARKCIEAIHGLEWHGKPVKATFGTTKYCNSFLKGIRCQNADCLYLHEVAEVEDSYTKEETKSAKFVQLVNAATLSKQQGSALKDGSSSFPAPSTPDVGMREGAAQLASVESLESAPETSSPDSWPSLGAKASWAAKAVGQGLSVSQQPPPLSVDKHEWPVLSAATSTSLSTAAAGVGVSGNVQISDGESQADGNGNYTNGFLQTLQRSGSSMAEKVARAASLPKNHKGTTHLNGSSQPQMSKLTPLVLPGGASARVLSPASSVPASSASASRSSSPTSGTRTPIASSNCPETVQENQPAAVEAAATHITNGHNESVSKLANHGSEAEILLDSHQHLGNVGSSLVGVLGLFSQQVEASQDAQGGPVLEEEGPGATRGGPPPGFSAAPISETQQGRNKRPGPPPGFVEPQVANLIANQDVQKSTGPGPVPSISDMNASALGHFAKGSDYVPHGQGIDVSLHQTLCHESKSSPEAFDIGLQQPISSGDLERGVSAASASEDPIVPPPPRKRNPVGTKSLNETSQGPSPAHQQQEAVSFLQQMLPHATVHVGPAPVSSSHPRYSSGFGGLPGGAVVKLGQQVGMGRSPNVGPEHAPSGQVMVGRQWSAAGLEIAQNAPHQGLQRTPQMGYMGRASVEESSRRKLSGAALLHSLQQGSTKQVHEQQPARHSLDNGWDRMPPAMWSSFGQGVHNGVGDPVIVGGTKISAGTHHQHFPQSFAPRAPFPLQDPYHAWLRQDQQLPQQWAAVQQQHQQWYINSDEALLGSFNNVGMYSGDRGPLQGR